MQKHKTSILLAEDCLEMREGYTVLLESEGYLVHAAADGESVLAMFRQERPDLVLLDIMMPKKNGYAVCSEIRTIDPIVPIIFLTGAKGDVNELRGMSIGADDYIHKSTSQAVFIARIATVLNRVRRSEQIACDFPFASAHVDGARFRLVFSDGSTADLSLREVEILRYLGQHPNEVISRDYLLTHFWERDFDGYETALSMAMTRLRRKLGSSGSVIESVYGRGYRYNPDH